MKIGYTVPLYISNETLESFANKNISTAVSDRHELYKVAVVNHMGEGFKVEGFDKYINRDENIVAGAWNDGIQECIDQGCQYIIVSNQDITIPEGIIDIFIDKVASDPKKVLWTGSTGETLKDYDLSFFIVHRTFLNRIGKFDEQYVPAYFEDDDMIKQIGAKKEEYIQYRDIFLYHSNSATINYDPEMYKINKASYKRNMLRFRKKWN